ncbi:bifunctional 2-polyprenyl-6-hydroxyphenol methylase/3-demethylubiquinol 3-O-methyltransferase UbiG [Massilia sp. ST3]|uniref:class I SAM-dependent methyltransferase n=1 Tax=Massilia sp. ST3 TaxID=2824903 RepID=UPI001B81BFC8|nr:class I SAM-dependent methyltransferase [Massilia sp. ST3]MBQ5949860.1 methyltransferase domain-containing protein [Massilia sp. ST3]
MNTQSDTQVLDAWSRNAGPWTCAVRGNEIASRVLVTNQAIVDAVRARAPRTGVDLGCGEGWLVRALPEVGMVGVDAIPELVEAARAAGGGDFRVMSYEEIAQGRLQLGADVAVCNFSLIGKEAVEGLLRAAPSYLRQGGALVVQTVHPVTACGDQPYVDGWREGSWAGFNSGFADAPPWYFRTVGSWVALFVAHGFRMVEMREPVHPETGKAVSLILVGELQG